MKKLSLGVITFMTCICTSNQSFSQDSTNAVVSILRTHVDGKSEVVLIYQISNKGSNSISLPQVLRTGVDNDPFADLIIEIEKKIDGNFLSYKETTDYNPVFVNIEFVSLSGQRQMQDSINISFYYKRFTNGIYRVRLYFKYSKSRLNQDIYSNWHEFEIDSPTKT